MLRQFTPIVDTFTPQQNFHLTQTQNLILNALQAMFPTDYDFPELTNLYNDQQIANNHPLLTYHLVNYFIQIVTANFVSIHSYSSLQTQTQKLQSTVRSHIKLQQQVKMYLQHLESKIMKYESYIHHYIRKEKQESPKRDEERLPSDNETRLLKERLTLIRRNDQLQRNLKEKEQELRKYNQMNCSHFGMVQNFIQKDKLTLSKSEHRLVNFRSLSECKSQGSPILSNRSLSRLKSSISEHKCNVLITVNGSRNNEHAQSHH